jgi:hypothetical protein
MIIPGTALFKPRWLALAGADTTRKLMGKIGRFGHDYYFLFSVRLSFNVY